MNEEIKDLNLEKDVKEFVKNKLRKIKSVEDIITSNYFKVTIQIVSTDLYTKLWKCKMVLQLLINLYNDYDIYERCTIKDALYSNFIKESDLLNSFYKYDQSVWRCYSRPTDIDLEKALYNYLLYFFRLRQLENSLKVEVVKDEDVTDICSFCDSDIPLGNVKCEVCDSLINEMNKNGRKDRIDVKKSKEHCINVDCSMKVISTDKNVSNNDDVEEPKTMNGLSKSCDDWKCGRCECLNEYTCLNCKVCEGNYDYGRWSCGECTEENSCSNDKCKACKNKNVFGEKEMNNFVKESNKKDCTITTKKDNIVEIGKDQWMCGKCGLLQSFDFIECSACDESRGVNGVWKCDKCTMINKCDNVRSGACEGENDYVKDIKNNKIDIISEQRTLFKESCMKDNGICNTLNEDDVKIGKDQWKCGKCGLLQSFDLIECTACGESRAGSGMWKCDKCTMINKCDNVRCGACEGDNESLKKEYCEHCKKNKVVMNEILCNNCLESTDYNWQCDFEHCRADNRMRNTYCYNCHFWRYNNLSRGALIRKQYYDKDTLVWFCYKCCHDHDDSKTNCENCGDTRYERKYCMDCKENNDGESLFCNKCRRFLS